MIIIQQKFLEELKILFDKYKIILDSEPVYRGEDEIYSGEIYTIRNEDDEINIEINDDLQTYLNKHHK